MTNQTDFEDVDVPRKSINDATPEEWDSVAENWFNKAEDPNVNGVVEQLLDRAAVGMVKYGVTTSQNPLTLKEWLKHAQEEAMDFTVYLQRIMEELDKTDGK